VNISLEQHNLKEALRKVGNRYSAVPGDLGLCGMARIRILLQPCLLLNERNSDAGEGPKLGFRVKANSAVIKFHSYYILAP
jgi:hypothetical protein